MSRGLGRIERQILAYLRGRGSEDRVFGAGIFINAIFQPVDAPDDWKPTRAQYTAVLRAMHSLARKYPESIELGDGKGREPLWLEWIEPDYEKVLGR
jgi:hypothetical protein